MTDLNDKADCSIGAPPDDLGEVAKGLWQYLTRAGQWGADLTICDRELFAQYCRLAARKHQADQKIDELGALVEGKDGFPVPNPWNAIANKAWADMLVIARELGGTPKSRERINKGGTAQPYVSDDSALQVDDGGFYDDDQSSLIAEALKVH